VIDHSELEPAALERAIIDSVLGHAHGSFQDDLTLVVAAIS
jgi:serine phosphatase RsbU (regulator of sigma subunit)